MNRSTFVPLTALVTLLTAPAADGSAIELQSDDRTTSASATAVPCGPTISSDNEAASGFDTFTSNLDADVGCALAGANASAFQDSFVGFLSMFGTGGVSTVADLVVPGGVQLDADSTMKVTFEFLAPCGVYFTGNLLASSSEGGVTSRAQSRFTRSDGTVIFMDSVTPFPDGSQHSALFEHGAILEAGQYTLHLAADADVDLELEKFGHVDTAASYSFSFAITDGAGCPDVNGDSVINIDDVIAVILAWGVCPPGGPCPADVNNSGIVDVDDVVDVVLSFGPCF